LCLGRHGSVFGLESPWSGVLVVYLDDVAASGFDLFGFGGGFVRVAVYWWEAWWKIFCGV